MKAAFLHWITAFLKAVHYIKFPECAVVFSSFDDVGWHIYFRYMCRSSALYEFAVDVLPLSNNKHFNDTKRR
jgi:hypothetical protein